MEKLSTPKLKKLIESWLSKPEYREELKHHSEMDDPNRIVRDWANKSDTTEMEYTRALWEAPDSVKTPEQLEEFIWKLWCDGDAWKREEKRKLKDEWDNYLACGESIWEGYGKDAKCTHTAGFAIDMIGDSNEDLVTRYFNDPTEAAKCIFRMFVPRNQLADNYRLEVVTTPDDTEVVGWTVIVD